jgi:uncharacterized membrane protein YeaQ/YmgE (transglycosylase-associated protein family)
MSLQAQVFIIIMVVGFVLGGIAALSDKGRGLLTYLVFGVVGSSVGGALLVPVFGIQLITADPIVTTIVHSTFVALICGCDANSFEPAGQAQMTRLQPNPSNALCGTLI